jgi:hypothetical protein
VIVDRFGRVIIVIIPPSASMGSVYDGAYEYMVKAAKHIKFPDGSTEKGHRRGKFNTLSLGVSYGGGQKVSRCREISKTAKKS